MWLVRQKNKNDAILKFYENELRLLDEELYLDSQTLLAKGIIIQ